MTDHDSQQNKNPEDYGCIDLQTTVTLGSHALQYDVDCSALQYSTCYAVHVWRVRHLKRRPIAKRWYCNISNAIDDDQHHFVRGTAEFTLWNNHGARCTGRNVLAFAAPGSYRRCYQTFLPRKIFETPLVKLRSYQIRAQRAGQLPEPVL